MRSNNSGGSVNVSGGIVNSPSGAATIQNTIVAGNTVVGSDTPDFNGVATSLGNNLIGSDSGNSDWIASDLVNVDPELGALADNGGPTKTHALLVGSPAIDAGNNSGAPATEQRGAPFVRVFNGAIDIGAYECQSLSLTVDTAVDEIDGNYSARNLSLREAIELSNANPGHDTIRLSEALSGPFGDTITLPRGELAVRDDLTITGPGATRLSLVALDSRVLRVAAEATVNLSGVTIRDGRAEKGAGVFNDGILTIDNIAFWGNSAASAAGGIYNSELATLVLNGSTMMGNTAAISGGGIYNEGGVVTITDSSISTNAADSASGGIYNESGTVAISGGTISGNTATNSGGAIHIAGGAVTISGGSVTGNAVTNETSGAGGGIFNGGGLTIQSSQIKSNTAARRGGGIYNAESGELSVTSSSMAENRATGFVLGAGRAARNGYRRPSIRSFSTCWPKRSLRVVARASGSLERRVA